MTKFRSYKEVVFIIIIKIMKDFTLDGRKVCRVDLLIFFYIIKIKSLKVTAWAYTLFFK